MKGKHDCLRKRNTVYHYSVAEVGRLIFKVEREDIEGEFDESWHGHFFKVVDPDTLLLGRIENLKHTKTSSSLDLEMRLVPGYKLRKGQINENPVCKGRFRWTP